MNTLSYDLKNGRMFSQTLSLEDDATVEDHIARHISIRSISVVFDVFGIREGETPEKYRNRILNNSDTERRTA